MSDEVDAGLSELISDQLGTDEASTPDVATQEAPGEQGEAPAEQTLESTQPATPAAQAQAAPAEQPTQAPPAEPMIELDLGDGRGPRQYTKEQLAQTLRQFPHLQQLHTENKQKLEQYERQRQPQAQVDPKRVLQNVRSSFDQEVQRAVQEGFVEEDFAILYPNLSASMMLIRDSLTQTNNIVQQQAAKIAFYEQQNQIQSLSSQVDNNMVALSTLHEAFAPLADPGEREQFRQFLVATNAPVELVLNDRDYLVSQWVASKKNQFLGPLDKVKADAAAAQQRRTAQKRQAQGSPLPGSRPSAAPQSPKTALEEMVDDFFSR